MDLTTRRPIERSAIHAPDPAPRPPKWKRPQMYLILAPRTANSGFYFAADGGMSNRKLMNDSWQPYPFLGRPPG